MPNPQIAQLIADHLHTGLPHPGDGQQPVTLPMPAFRTTGMPPQLAEQITATRRMLGEAVVYLIETAGNSTIITNTELETMTAATQEPGTPQPITCTLCGNPIFYSTINNGRITATPQAINTINTTCPHTVGT